MPSLTASPLLERPYVVPH